MAAKTVHIEICDQITKVCRITKKGKTFRVEDAFLFETPEDSVADGVIENAAILGAALREQLISHALGDAKEVVFTLTSNRIAAREVRLPQMKEKLIGSAIHTNAAEYFPVDLKNYHISYTVLDTVKGPDGFIRVMVYAAPTAMLDGYDQLAEETGLRIKAVDCAANGQYQALRRLGPKDGVTIFVDVGSGSSSVSFLCGNKLLMQRVFGFGADELVGHYISANGGDYIGALRATDVTSGAFAADVVLSQDEVQEDLSRFVGGIVHTLDFFNSSQWDCAATHIVLMGALRHIVGLREQIADATGLPADFLDDITEFTAFTGASPEAAAYISCIGSAVSPLNIVSYYATLKSGKKAGPDDISLKPGIAIGAAFVVLAVVMAALSIHGYNTAQRQVADAQKQIESLAPAKKVYETYVSYEKGQKALQTVIDGTKTPNAQLAAFFGELEQKMPSSILLLSADCTETGVSMNITVANYQDAADVVAELREFDSLLNIEVSEATQEANDLGVSRVSFSVTCTYGKNPWLNNENPYQDVITPPSPSSGTAEGEASPNATQTTGG